MRHSAAAEILLNVLRENLSLKEFDMDSQFYAHGGDSLIAVRVVNDARARGIPISLRDLMVHQTARGILSSPAVAAALAGNSVAATVRREDAESSVFLPAEDLARVPAGVVAALPASAMSIAVLYLCEVSRDPALYHLMEGWEVRAAFDEASFRTALAELNRRHPALRTSFDLGGLAVPAQLVWERADPALTVLHAQSSEGASVLLREWRDRQLDSLIDWSSAPLVRYCVIVAPELFYIVSSAHHAVLDGWSLSRLAVDLMTLYHARAEGRIAEPSAVSVVDVQPEFIAAERAAESSGMAAEYWLRHADVPALLSAGSEHAQVADAREHRAFELESSLVASLGGVARMLNAPLKSVFLAAHARALGTWTGRSHDVVTGVVFNTRPSAEGSDLAVGLFLNTLPVRFATVDGTWASLVREAAEAERECVSYRAYPHARLVALLGRPAFDVVFNFMNFYAYRELDRLAAAPTRGWWRLGKPSFPFHVNVEMVDKRGQVRIGFDPAFVPAAAVEAYAGTFKDALRALAANPVSPASVPVSMGDRRV